MTFEVVSVAVVAYVFYRERHLFAGFLTTLGNLTWYWVVLALVAELASILPLAEAQLHILSAGGTEAALRQMILVTFASNAISMSLPAGVAFAEGYSYARYRHFGAGPAVAAWAELASGTIAFSALAAIALAGAAIGGGGAEPVLLSVLSVVFAGSAGAVALFRRPHLLVRAIDWFELHLGRRLGRVVAEAAKSIRDTAHFLTHVHPSIGTWMTAYGLSALNWLLDVLSLALAFQAVGGPIPWGAVLLAFAGSKVIMSIGITPGGLGIVEGGLVATFVAYGTKGSTAAAASLVYRGLTLIGLVGTGWVCVAILAAETHHQAGVERTR